MGCARFLTPKNLKTLKNKKSLKSSCLYPLSPFTIDKCYAKVNNFSHSLLKSNLMRVFHKGPLAERRSIGASFSLLSRAGRSLKRFEKYGVFVSASSLLKLRSAEGKLLACCEPQVAAIEFSVHRELIDEFR